METLILPAPGKLNLFLHVNGRRHDGYHDLQTIFQLVDLADTLVFSPRDDHLISLEADILGVAPRNNLVMRAAKLLQQYDKKRRGVTIFLDKKLPMGAGLGGGSSDAATTLVGLNELWQLKLPLDQLLALGRQLGADVPVFILGRSCWAEGIGDVMTPLNLPPAWYVIVKPPVHVSTAEIFFDKDLPRNTPRVECSMDWAVHGHNDCQMVTLRHYPEIQEAFDWLSQFGTPKMTGTGSCLFLTCPDAESAQKIVDLAPAAYQAVSTCGLNTSSLLTSLHASR